MTPAEAWTQLATAALSTGRTVQSADDWLVEWAKRFDPEWLEMRRRREAASTDEECYVTRALGRASRS